MTGLANPKPVVIDGEARFKLTDALPVAEHLVSLLKPCCERVEIAGSVRRGKVWVKDVEIVAVPRMVGASTDLFGDPVDPQSAVKARLDHMAEAGEIEKRVGNDGGTCWGVRHQRAVYMGVPVDFFSVLPPASWGVIFTVRTGPTGYVKHLVTSTGWGGLMPWGMSVADGCLWRDGDRVDTPEEEDFFAEIGQPMPAPSARRNP